MTSRFHVNILHLLFSFKGVSFLEDGGGLTPLIAYMYAKKLFLIFIGAFIKHRFYLKLKNLSYSLFKPYIKLFRRDLGTYEKLLLR